MSFYEDWNKKSEDTSDMSKYQNYMREYYELEQKAYDKILSAYPDNSELTHGTVNELSNKLGFGQNLDIFVGFLEGINSSLTEQIDVRELQADSQLALEIDYRKLLYNMHAAKANWLFKLDAWKNVLSAEEIAEIGKNYRREHIASSNKIGRNDPCFCNSGKKYKNCCMHKQVESDAE